MLKAGRLRERDRERWIFFFNLSNTFSQTMALGSTQPLTEISTRSLLELKGGWRVRLTNVSPSVSRLSIQNVGASMSGNTMGHHGLLPFYNLKKLKTLALYPWVFFKVVKE
jgi:hypothetical protein